MYSKYYFLCHAPKRGFELAVSKR